MAYFTTAEWSQTQSDAFPELAAVINRTRGISTAAFLQYADVFYSLFATQFAKRFLHGELEKVSSFADYAEIISDDEIEIFQDDCFKICVTLFGRDRPHFATAPEVMCYANDFVFGNLGPSPLEVEVYEVPHDQVNNVFDKRHRPKLIGRQTQDVGESIAVRAGKDVIKLLKPTGPVYQIYAFCLQPTYSLVWHYDADSLDPKYCTASSVDSSRLEMATAILARMGGAAALPTVMAVSRSSEHFVRWSAIKAACAIDPQAGRYLLEDALRDPHPHIRAAALKALEG